MESDIQSIWIEKRSKRHPDKIYYFNMNTGESSWENPGKCDTIKKNFQNTGQFTDKNGMLALFQVVI